MSTYLERHPPRAWQMGPTVNGVRVANSPTCVLHTYQADWTAARGADYIRTRPDSAGYHHLTGLDQDIQLAPWNYATAHAIPVNVWAKGFSCMWFAGRWSQLSAKDRRTLVHGMAKGVYDYSQWRVRNGMSAIIPRKISRAQAMRGENGIVYHGDLQSDRTDPGNDFPLQMFLTELRRLQSGGATPAAPPVKEGTVMSAKEFWDYRGEDFVNDSPNRKDFQLARVHQYGLNVWNRIRSNDWRSWVATGVMRWRGLDYVNENPSSKDAQIARAHQYSLLAAQRSREANDKIEAVADAVAELVGQIDANTRKALEDRLAAIKTESARVSAEEVAAELEVTVKEDQEDDS